jgi:hypothetical protein
MNRWLLVQGRIGTILISVGLALLLVSLTPPTTRTSFASGSTIAPDTFQPIGKNSGPFDIMNATFYSQFFSTLTPQQELIVELNCSGPIEVYLLKIDLNDLMDNFPGTDRNTTLLEEFLLSNSDLIGWQGNVQEGVVDYIPTEVINATLIFSNPSPNRISIDYTGRILSLFAPSEKVKTLAIWAIPIGLVLALPLVLDLRKSKKITISS